MNAAFEAYLRQDSHDLLEGLRTKLGDETVEIKAVANPSPAHGPHEVAEAEDGALIVVGSTHTGRAGRVLPGSTAERLLHGSPCPVAVAPKGYSQRPGREPGIIGCAYIVHAYSVPTDWIAGPNYQQLLDVELNHAQDLMGRLEEQSGDDLPAGRAMISHGVLVVSPRADAPPQGAVSEIRLATGA